MSKQDLLDQDLAEIEMLNMGIKKRMDKALGDIKFSERPLSVRWKAYKRACRAVPEHNVASWRQNFKSFNRDNVTTHDSYLFEHERYTNVHVVDFYRSVVRHLWNVRRVNVGSSIDVLNSLKSEIIALGITAWNEDW